MVSFKFRTSKTVNFATDVPKEEKEKYINLIDITTKI